MSKNYQGMCKLYHVSIFHSGKKYLFYTFLFNMKESILEALLDYFLKIGGKNNLK